MADRVPLPRVSTAFAAAMTAAGPNVGGIDSTAAPSAATATTSSTSSPLEAPVARAALLTMASELTVLDTPGFLSGPVGGGGRDFTRAYRCVFVFG